VCFRYCYIGLCYGASSVGKRFSAGILLSLGQERQPTLNPKSGLPHTFENIPISLHVELQKKSILELKAVSLYAALVTSLYFARAVGKYNPIKNHEDRQRIAEFLPEQKARQRNLLGSLRKDPYLRSACSDRAIEYNHVCPDFTRVVGAVWVPGLGARHHDGRH
jgi:uncharacterized protein DUF3891